MALLSIYRGTQAEVSERSVSDGALLFATDTKKIYLDKGSSRVEMSSLQDLSDYVTNEELTERLATKAPLSHNHTTAQVTGLDSALAGKASTGHTHAAATDAAAGFMSAADKEKLDGIATGANKYTLPTASSSTLGGVKTGANITNSSGTISLTKANVTAALGYTPPTADTNTWIAFKGATTSAAGTAGYAPAPAAGAANRYLRSDGTWAVPPDTNTDTNTTYTLTKSGSTITLTGSNGSKTSVTDSNTTYTLSSFGITATAAEINKLDGLTATTAELNYVDGVTSNIQTQLNGKAASSHSHNYAGSSSAGGAATSAAKLNGISLVSKNLNDYHSGVNFYYGGGENNCTNKPSGVDNFGMFVFQTANGWWTQLLYGSDDHLYMRRWASDSWTSWVELYSSNNKPTASEIGAAAASHNHSAANITSGTLAVARGGTGITANPSMLTNLGSTTAAGVFQTSPRPGITGTLSIAHGGTGATTAAAARSALGAAASNHTHSYLPLSGGTVTGQIKKAGTSTSWYTGRDVAMIRTTSCADTAYNPLWSAKSYQGSWECGPYIGNTLHFSYITDTNYSKKNNAQTADIQFTTAGAVIANTFQGALSGNASTATKLQTARTIALSGDVTGSASFNGSANATISAQIAANAVGTNEIAANAVTASEIASNAVTLAKLGSDVGTIAVQSSTPTDANVKLWIQIQSMGISVLFRYAHFYYMQIIFLENKYRDKRSDE